MKQDFIIRSVRVVDPSQGLDGLRDVWIQNGKIKAIEMSGVLPQDLVKDADDSTSSKKLWMLPGFIDVHVHLREPGYEYKETIESGTRAAIQGGFTSIACMANTHPVNDTPYVTAYIREKAKSVGHCRVFPIGAVTKGLKGEELAEIGGMVREGVVAISDDGMPVMNSYLMRKAMDYAKAFEIPVISHAEDSCLVGKGVMNEGALSNELGLRGNPSAAEEIMVAREIALCRLTRARVHIAHLSTQEGLMHVRRAKEEGLPITAEVCPHHLFLTEECIRNSQYNTHYKMAPPLRTQKDVESLIQGLADGVIDIIATDHAPHSISDKKIEFDCAANGITGLETAVALTYDLVKTGKISLARWVDALAYAPAQLIGQHQVSQGQLGTLRVGADADFVLFDPEQHWVFTEEKSYSKSQNSPFIGNEFSGKVIKTFIRGREINL